MNLIFKSIIMVAFLAASLTFVLEMLIFIKHLWLLFQWGNAEKDAGYLLIMPFLMLANFLILLGLMSWRSYDD